MGKAFLSTSAEMCIDKAAGVMGGDGWHWSAKLTGKVGGEVSKQVCKNLEQGKKWNDGLEKAAFNGTVDYVTDKMDKITGGASGEAAKKVWSNLEEGKDWSDGVGSAAFNGGVKGGIDHLADKVKDMQKENRMETFKNDTANMARAEQNGMSKKGLESLEKLRNDTWVENKKAEEAFGLVTDAIKNESKDIYDKVTGEMGKYERDLTKEHNEKMLKDLANRKAENARLAEERKIQEYRDAIRSNAQQPL
jgi:hypothetical protein